MSLTNPSRSDPRCLEVKVVRRPNSWFQDQVGVGRWIVLKLCSITKMSFLLTPRFLSNHRPEPDLKTEDGRPYHKDGRENVDRKRRSSGQVTPGHSWALGCPLSRRSSKLT